MPGRIATGIYATGIDALPLWSNPVNLNPGYAKKPDHLLGNQLVYVHQIEWYTADFVYITISNVNKTTGVISKTAFACAVQKDKSYGIWHTLTAHQVKWRSTVKQTVPKNFTTFIKSKQ